MVNHHFLTMLAIAIRRLPEKIIPRQLKLDSQRRHRRKTTVPAREGGLYDFIVVPPAVNCSVLAEFPDRIPRLSRENLTCQNIPLSDMMCDCG